MKLAEAEEIFNQALELATTEERSAFLKKVCGRNDALREKVERLLVTHESLPEFLADSPGTVTLRLPLTEKPGDLIGRYKLLQKIGEGGMGVVYMAQQEEPVRRKVALKIIKLGMDTKQVVARFEAERQALALMDHPNIAKVLDAGATDTGRPYFVMELVQGVPITEFCDKNRLPAEERIKLFITVCQAIQSAHQKGIIHRDLKPTNILVTLNAGVPMPMVIDFGVAKATQQKLTEKTLFTQYAAMIGTPAYMSPEQAEMSRLDVDTRSDIYGLGVLLYELLTGTTPFPEKRLRSASYHEMQRIILEEEPERPSTRLSTLQGEQRGIVARNCGASESALGRVFAGDLDWIVMKCLEKDRARRYETANGLAADLKRHLNNEPVVARPPSNLYRFQKLVRRNKVAFAAGTAVAAALLVGLAVSTFLFSQERHAHDSATRAEKLAQQRLTESEANATLATQRLADSEAISKFLTEVFQSPDPARDGRTITVAETLSNAAIKLETDLTNQAARRAKLQATVARTYNALGLYREAIQLQEKVHDYYLTNSGPEHPETLRAMYNLLAFNYHADRWDEVIKLAEPLVALRRKASGPEHPDTLHAMSILAAAYANVGRRDEALKLREQLVPLFRKVLGPKDPSTLNAMDNLADSYAQTGRLDEALKLWEEVLALSRKVNGPEHPDTLFVMNNLADCYGSAGRPDEALKLREQVVTLSRKVLGLEHPFTLAVMNNMADCYFSAGRPDEALKLREQVLPLSRKVRGPEHPFTLAVMSNLANAYFEAGRIGEATAVLAKECELVPRDTGASFTLATAQSWFGQNADYEATRRRVVQLAEGTDQAETADRAAKVACLRPSTDAALLTNALNLAQRAVELGKKDQYLPWYQLAVGLAEYRNEKYAACEQTLTVVEETVGDHHDLSAASRNEIQGTARLFRAMSLFRQDKPEEARIVFRQAGAQMHPLPKDESKPIIDGKYFDRDLSVMWLAYKEAKALIEGPSAPLTP